MSPTANQVLQAALSLPHEERSELAFRLCESVDGFATPEIAAAWEEEIAKRIKEADEGREPSIPAEEVYRQLQTDYGVLKD